MTPPKIAFRAAILDAMSEGWMTTGDVAIRVSAAEWAAQSALRAMARSGLVISKRRATDKFVLWRKAEVQKFLPVVLGSTE